MGKLKRKLAKLYDKTRYDETTLNREMARVLANKKNKSWRKLAEQVLISLNVSLSQHTVNQISKKLRKFEDHLSYIVLQEDNECNEQDKSPQERFETIYKPLANYFEYRKLHTNKKSLYNLRNRLANHKGDISNGMLCEIRYFEIAYREARYGETDEEKNFIDSTSHEIKDLQENYFTCAEEYESFNKNKGKIMNLEMFDVIDIKEENCEDLIIKEEISVTDTYLEEDYIYNENKDLIKETEYDFKQESNYDNSDIRDEICRDANFIKCDIESTRLGDDYHEKNTNPKRNKNHQSSSEVLTSQLDNFGQICNKKKLHICTECDYKTTKKYHFTRHLSVHTGDKPFECTYCNYSSSRKENLRDHIRSHKGEKPYRCNDCNYATANKSNLRSHVRYHTKERPYRCTYCEYSSADSSTLKRHVRVHTGERPYKCTNCDFSASDRSTLKRHNRIHIRELL